MNKFDYLNSITYNKENIMTNEYEEGEYDPFLINRGLSYFRDTVSYAQDMNRYGKLPNRLQFEYLLNSIRPARRFSKWPKAESNEDINLIMEYYNISRRKAMETLELLSKDQLNEIKQEMEQGGIVK